MQRPRGAASGVRRQATSSPQELFSVQITGLPPGVSSQSLVDRFQQSAGQFVIPPEPKQRDKTAWCAYLNGLTENQAETFQERWNNKIFPGGQHPIRCKTSSSKLKGSENIQGKATQPQPMIYNVELSGLPPNASNKFLAATFKQSAEKFEVLPEPKQRDKTAWCAYLNDVPESEAHRFIQKYDNFKIGNNKFVVRCKLIFKADRRTTEDRSRVRSRVHGDSLRQQTEKLGAEASSSQSSVSTTHSETTNQDKGILCKYNILGTCKFDNDCKHIHMSCPMEEDCDDDECCLGHPANVKTQIGRSVGRRLVLCNLFRFGACRYESECRFKHLDCPLAELCEDSCCFFGHPQGWGSDFSDPNECSVDCDQYDCTKSHPVGRTKRCQFGDKCTKFECSFLHSEKRQACESAGDCQDFDCPKLHPESREKPCEKGAKCLEFHCQKLHPASRELCDKGKLCTEYACDKLHEAGRRKKCKWRDRCKLPFCPWLHPINRSRQFCDRGDSCDDFDCALVHPPGRCSPCKYGERCWNHICECLHPEAWNPCPNGLGCRDVTCDCSHSPRRPKPCTQGSDCRNRDCAGLHPGMSSVSNAPLQRSSALKSDHQRRIDREANRLPVLNYREQFLERLQNEKVLIVRAETGSGKTTQLPQYAAECFGGLVICTQPRVMAAVSIAHRVAQEFDGCDVGESVGYKVGGENSAPGSGIMFMTESCLIRYCQSNESLDNVSVLIVDEAHERSLNVDIVLGLAKLIRIKRPDNFYVVIASATIDPQLFRDFFNCGVLDIPGRMYDVSLQYIPPAFDSNPDVFIKSHLVPSLIKALRDHSDGYALVFLPGEREIQQAIKAFQQQQTEDNCVALPLYGSLPREEQVKVLDFKPSQDSDRLVVFCTNVAETSLTINGVRLVVDSGLAKESRFDAKRRITVLELRQISQSAANQRKGRAGRTAPGHCVRLYSEDVLKSAEFVPEILRSSLDLVVLLLIKLKLKPLEFPFLDKPNEEMLIHSYQTLMDLGCLSGVESLSNAGELFAELGLDPRLSAFIVRAHEHFGHLELAVTVACILTAPGSIFFLGRDKEKKEGLQKRALEAFSHESDILYEVSVFDSWSNAGKLINGKCKNCGKVARNFQNSCRSCRVGHSNSNRLNNKVMEHIEKTRTSFLKTIKKSKWFLELQKVESSCEDTIQVVGSCLEQVIPEQVTCLLVKRLPSEGIKIVDSNIRARISNTSVFAQRPQDCEYFVAVRVRQMVSGMYIVDGLHPLKDPTTVSDRRSHPLEKIFTEANASSNLLKAVNSKIKDESSQISEEQRRWIVLSHNADEASIDVYARASESSELRSKLKSLIDKSKLSYLQEQHMLETKGFRATFQGGLQVKEVHICTLNRTDSEVSSSNNEGATDSAESDNGLAQLLVSAPCGFEEETIRAHSDSTAKIHHTNQRRRRQEKFKVFISNMPANWKESDVQDLIRKSECLNAVVPIRIFPPAQPGIGTSRALLTLNSETERDSLIKSLSTVLCNIGPFPISLISKKSGGTFVKQVSPEIKPCEDKTPSIPELFFVKFNESKHAVEFYNKIRAGSIVGCSAEWTESVFISHPDLFPDLNSLIEQSGDPTVKSTSVPKPDKTLEIRLSGPQHDKIKLVANKLRILFSPITIRHVSNKEKTLFYEIKKTGLFDAWAKELNLVCEFRDDWNFRVFGSKVSQGSLMRKIADEFTKLESRYRLIPLNAATTQLFRNGLAGDSKLKALQRKWDQRCFIKFLFHTSEIELFARKDSSVLSDCEKEVNDLVAELGSKNILGQKTCVVCRSKSAVENFFICGHPYCKCIDNWLQSVSAASICCPKCQTPITIREIRKLTGDNFEKLAVRQVAHYVAQDPSMKIARCIIKDCNGFVNKGSYESCACCEHWVCVDCKVADDVMHRGLSCSEFKKASTDKEPVSRLIKAAEVYVRQNWPADMPPICAIDVNPGLLSNPPSPAYKTFHRGLLSLNRGILHESDGIFAFHGSSSEALRQICHSGFDPKRRSGQACGPGEYFGVTPSISRGYSRNCGAMIVAFLLNGGPITHRQGFCYVVNNPTDGSKSFNLPVLVVYFDSSTPRLDFIKPVANQSQISEPFENDNWRSPFRWHWQKDGGRFEPYTDEFNRLLESQYDAYRMHSGPAQFTTPPIRRYIDDTPQPYTVNFSANTQRNVKTGYVRSIQRQQVVINVSVSTTWQYQNENGIWQPFESLVQRQIQQAYVAYTSGSGSCKARVQFPGRPETYELDFLQGQQTNLQSGTKRPIRKN